MGSPWRLLIVTAALLCTRCGGPRVAGPCGQARTLRQQAEATADSYERSLVEAKAQAAEELCRQESMRNSERAYEAERRHYREQ